MDAQRREQFDFILDEQVAMLPEELHDLLEQVPLIVEDEPSARLMQELEMQADEDLCGLHDGVPLTEQSVSSSPETPDRMMLFRGPIWRLAQEIAAEQGVDFPDALEQQIHITLLHEIGHHFGLDEEDLEQQGYG